MWKYTYCINGVGPSPRSPVTPAGTARLSAPLNNERTPGVGKQAHPDVFEPFVDDVSRPLAEDPHLWARTLCDELEGLGFNGQVKVQGLGPCRGKVGEVLVGPFIVEPVDPVQGAELDVVDVAPRPLPAGQLVLE
jgi:hypothetical protein